MILLRPALFVLCILALVFLAWENYDLWWKVPGKEVPEDRNPMTSIVLREPCPEGMGATTAGCRYVIKKIDDRTSIWGLECKEGDPGKWIFEDDP